MSKRRLIERLKDPTPDYHESFQKRKELLETSIRAHLIKLLNTKQGSVLTQPDYGMPDLASLYSGGTQVENESNKATEAAKITEAIKAARIKEAIKAAIDKYEPRLKVERIEQVESGNRFFLQFHIAAQLVIDNNRKEPIFYHTDISRSGSVSLRREDVLPRRSEKF
jgi:type VI secretion system protein